MDSKHEIKQSPVLLQLFIRNLTGKTLTLKFTTAKTNGFSIKSQINKITTIPISLQRLIYSGRLLNDDDVLSTRDASISLFLPLRGGKGGFGSLLRGAATKAGQKKTNNFDACRDMSGRRLRHVNAEKKLEEWRMEEEERKLEKIAEDFCKKRSGKGKKKDKGVDDIEVAKYLQKYREDSEKCTAVVEEAVKAVYGKRKGMEVAKDDKNKKKLKIWMGKRKVAESDVDSSDDDSDEEKEKSVVLNNVKNSDLSKENEGSSGSVGGGNGKLEADDSGEGSFENGSEEEGDMKQNLELNVSSEGIVEQLNNKAVETTSVSCFEEVIVQSSVTTFQTEEGNENKIIENTNSEACEAEIVINTTNITEPEGPLNFDNYNSAVEMEVLGLERLKSELQAHGLKCGGTLQERAARLFLLKSTPIDKLPKKLLAKK
ncbi:hypothetical protein ACFE04_026626 [Oxalis oulophora]